MTIDYDRLTIMIRRVNAEGKRDSYDDKEAVKKSGRLIINANIEQ